MSDVLDRTHSTGIDGSAIDAVLRDAVASGAVPHVAAIAADTDGIVYEGAAGVRTVGVDETPVGTSTQFRIMSMTKMIVTAVALQQVERGELDLDAPVESYRPEFGDLQVLEGFDGDSPRLRAPRSKATVKQLITHTSGLTYWFWNAEMVRYEALTGLPNVVPGRLDALRAPLVADPGTRFEYGINTDWLGRVTEAVGGSTLDQLVAQGITDPLRMNDTMFILDAERKRNEVSVHVPSDAGWVSAGDILNQEPEWFAGGHGLYSTPRDYIRFEQALLRGGELDGERILRRETVDAAFQNQIGDLDVPEVIPTADPATTDSFLAGPGRKWGYGLLLTTKDVPGGRRAGTGAWAGLFNTHFFVDRASGICASIYTNSLPFVEEHTAWKMYGDFEQALYSAL
ncbi:serine hydrolase domain-containing protein [uncultured Amnibacterium sp.]|uniref:serine hydrolase domain-containing protein n=1 Tax=uncultured Amnibacterium sp. TaxID=1631851 RepID=UPI0035C998BA